MPHIAEEKQSYHFNRAPLLMNKMEKLPLGAIQPKGWLRHQLDLMVEGMTGKLSEISSFLKADNGWFGGGNEGWEEQGYWFRGFYDLGVLTSNQRIKDESKTWIEAILNSQDSDGYFGATYHKVVEGNDEVKVSDIWPHMVMIDALIHHHEATSDSRVIPLLTKFFEFCRHMPDSYLIPPYKVMDVFGNWKPAVQTARSGDMLPHLYWLYNRTGEENLLPLATTFFRRTAAPQDEWLDHHVVHFAQRFRYPGNYYVQSHDPLHLELTDYWYQQHMLTWGQQPGGIFAGDEQLRPGKVDPRQGFETCGMTEFNKSFYILGRITGDTRYADRCENITFNHFSASQTPDLKALHYLTASNQPQLDSSGNHDYTNKGRQIDYSPHLYRCCQHNVAMGWPWFAQNLWQASADGGLVAWIYGASIVHAKVLAGQPVQIQTDTEYPFDGDVSMRITSNQSVVFPLYLRIPDWCRDFRFQINNQPISIETIPGSYIRIEREWKNKDHLTIQMDMEIQLKRWPRNGSVSVRRGPLFYSLKIEEDWRRCGGTEEWPEWEVYPSSPWNYGLHLDSQEPGGLFSIVPKKTTPDQPWTIQNAPLELKVKAQQIPEWTLVDETVMPLQSSPVISKEPTTEVSLIPMGCARLRIACFPVVDTGEFAYQWEAPTSTETSIKDRYVSPEQGSELGS